MNYQIYKYDAIKAALRAGENDNDNLSMELLRVIWRAANHEIKQKKYKPVYIITESEKKLFEKSSYKCIIRVIEE